MLPRKYNPNSREPEWRDQWQRQVDVTPAGGQINLPTEGLLSALEQVETAVKRVLVVEDNFDAARLVQRLKQALPPR